MHESSSLHPDLHRLGHQLRRSFDAVLDAEREAAAVVARRTSILRDQLIQAEDEGVRVEIVTTVGRTVSGVVNTVAADHVALDTCGKTHLVILDSIVEVLIG